MSTPSETINANGLSLRPVDPTAENQELVRQMRQNAIDYNAQARFGPSVGGRGPA